MVYSLNGDLLKVVEEQKVEVKSVFLNSREDYLCVAANISRPGFPKSGWLRVLNLYGLNLVSDLTGIIYTQTLKTIYKNKPPQQLGIEGQIPTIQAVAVGAHERSISIFFVRQTIENDMVIEEGRESISFLSYMVLIFN